MLQINNKIVEAFDTLGVKFTEIMSQSKSLQDAKKYLEESQSQAKDSFKKLAFESHPDRGGNEDQFKLITSAYNIIKDVKIFVPQPRLQYRIVPNFNGFGHGTSTSYTSTTTGGW